MRWRQRARWRRSSRSRVKATIQRRAVRSAALTLTLIIIIFTPPPPDGAPTWHSTASRESPRARATHVTRPSATRGAPLRCLACAQSHPRCHTRLPYSHLDSRLRARTQAPRLRRARFTPQRRGSSEPSQRVVWPRRRAYAHMSPRAGAAFAAGRRRRMVAEEKSCLYV